jgi:biopolymer transport protein ExbD
MAVELRKQRQSYRFHSMKLLGHGGHGCSGDVALNVTAFVDMMMVLVIFLVMNFNASGEMLFLSKDMKMALSQNGMEVTRVPIISISFSDPNRCEVEEGQQRNADCIPGDGSRDLYFEGLPLGVSLNELDENELVIAELEEKLVDNRKKFEMVGGSRSEDLPPEEDPTTTVNVQVHGKTDFNILRKVMTTCEQAGYGRIRFTTGDGRKADGGGHGEGEHKEGEH